MYIFNHKISIVCVKIRFLSLFLIFLLAKNPLNFVRLWWAMDFQMVVLATRAMFRERFCHNYTYFCARFTSVHNLRSNSMWKILREQVNFQDVSAHSLVFVNRGLFILSACGQGMPTSFTPFFITYNLPKKHSFSTWCPFFIYI